VALLPLRIDTPALVAAMMPAITHPGPHVLKYDPGRIMASAETASEGALVFRQGGQTRYDPFMCGRFTLKTRPEVLAEHFELTEVPGLEPRYNIAPTQPVAVVRAGSEGDGRELSLLRWGLIPFWADDPAIGNRMINARAETVAEKSAYRAAFRHRRCLVLADGFFEWAKANGVKQPHYFQLKDGGPFAFAGLWELSDNLGVKEYGQRDLGSAAVLADSRRRQMVGPP
jgi:putative SOS response-associated peptidase YedK